MYVDGFPLVQQRKNIENTTTFCNNEYWYGIFRLSVLIKGGWGALTKMASLLRRVSLTQNEIYSIH